MIMLMEDKGGGERQCRGKRKKWIGHDAIQTIEKPKDILDILNSQFIIF